MKHLPQLLLPLLLGCLTCAGESPSFLRGKVTVEVEVNGKVETQELDLSDPATVERLKDKVIVITEVNGKRETRLLDRKDADNLPPPFLLNEKPPVRTGPVTFLGIGAIEVPADVAAQLPLARDTGLLLAIVLPDSPAAAAGLQESDVLHKFEDQLLITPRQLAVLIANRKQGDVVKLSILRKGQPLEISATLATREAPHNAESPDKMAKVTRQIVELGTSAGTGAKAFAAKKLQVLKDSDSSSHDSRIHSKDGSQTPGLPDREVLEAFPAEAAVQDVRRDIRRALDKLPAESRPGIERLLIESGALPKNTLPPEK